MIEGRYPRVYISSNIAQLMNEKVNYMEQKGLSNKYYMDYIKEYLSRFDQATRQEINSLIYPKLPSDLSEDQKDQRIKYLLTTLRKLNIIVNIGSDTKSIWVLNRH